METSRERIQGAALRLFALHGFDGVSLQRIADEVGLHKSSLFHHYKNKDELARDVFEAAMVKVVDTMRPLEAETPRLKDLYSSVDELTDYFSDNPEAARLVVALMVAPNESTMRLSLSEKAEHPATEFFSILWSWLSRAKALGVIGEVNVRQAIFNLIGAVVLYPAAAEETPDVAGKRPFSKKHRETRKRELRRLIKGALK